MKTPEEFKKNLVVCMDEAIEVAENSDAHDLLDFAHHAHARMSETLTYIQQLEANWHQVSKALCGKGNATLVEVLQVIDQVKAELAFVTLERDALFSEIKQCNDCYFCKHYGTRIDVEPCQTCILDFQQQDFKPGFEWRGACPENTEVQPND